jgi:hypothetical protein
VHYQANVEVNDQPNADGSGLERSLHFTLTAPFFVDTPAACASLRDASVTFNGQPVDIFSRGGWETTIIPTGSRPGETTASSSCEGPGLYLLDLPEAAGEPQNGALAIDGADGRHLEVPFHKDFGVPDASLISVAADKIVVRLQGFATPPTLAETRGFLLLPGSSYPPTPSGLVPAYLQTTALSADGQLELALRPIPGGASTTLGVEVNLGADMFRCPGFAECFGSGFVRRELHVDVPGP